MSKIIVGVDESDGSYDAIALASRLAGLTGAELVLANVFPYDTRPSRALSPEFEEYLREDSRELLERLGNGIAETVDFRSVANPSPAHGLHELAEHEDAVLIVVGSTHTGRMGRVLPGSTAERLLHGSPCPVAVAPKGYAQRPGEVTGVVGCGFDGSESSQRALLAAQRLAASAGARLRIIRAFQPISYDFPPGSVAGGGVAYNDRLQSRASEELDAAVAGLGDAPRAEGSFAVGSPAKILVEASGQLDLLLVGSRGYGPLRSVVLGGVAGRVVREAACPVIVLPRRAGHVEEDSVFERATAAHG